MATQIGFVDVVGAIEPKALAGGIARNAHHRLGELVALTCGWLEEDSNGLNEKQRIALTANASMLFDGFEGDGLKEILQHVERIRLEGGEA
jgi:hypothetical protein